MERHCYVKININIIPTKIFTNHRFTSVKTKTRSNFHQVGDLVARHFNCILFIASWALLKGMTNLVDLFTKEAFYMLFVLVFTFIIS